MIKSGGDAADDDRVAARSESTARDERYRFGEMTVVVRDRYFLDPDTEEPGVAVIDTADLMYIGQDHERGEGTANNTEPMGTVDRAVDRTIRVADITKRVDKSPNAPSHFDAPRFGEFIILRNVGRSAFEDLSLAYSTETKTRPIVLRRLIDARLPARKARFIADAQAGLTLRHPNIVRVLGHGEQDGQPYLVREIIEGKSLGALAETIEGAVAPRIVLNIGLQVARALHHAHGRGLVHQELSPRTIIVGRDGWVQITELGAILEDVDGRRPGVAGYAAPEQRRGLEIDGRTDLFSLGIVLAELATGATLATADSSALRRRLTDCCRQARVPDELVELLSSMTAIDRAERPANAAEVVDELSHQAEQRGLRLSLENDLAEALTGEPATDTKIQPPPIPQPTVAADPQVIAIDTDPDAKPLRDDASLSTAPPAPRLVPAASDAKVKAAPTPSPAVVSKAVSEAASRGLDQPLDLGHVLLGALVVLALVLAAVVGVLLADL